MLDALYKMRADSGKAWLSRSLESERLRIFLGKARLWIGATTSKEEGRGTRNGYEASKGSKGISGL